MDATENGSLDLGGERERETDGRAFPNALLG